MAKVLPINQANLCINGSLDFWQRGTSFAGIAAGVTTYGSDRFLYAALNTTGIVTMSQDTDIPTLDQSGFQSSFSIKVQPTTADATLGATDVARLGYRMEGNDYKKLKGKKIGISFWVKSNKIGTYCISVQNNGADRSYILEYTINVSNTWEHKVLSLPLNYTGGTDNFGTAKGLEVSWTLMSGTTYQAAVGAWQTGEFYGTSNQVNFMDNVANIFRLAQVQIVEDAVKSSFSRHGITRGAELEACQRYYEKSYEEAVAPGSIANEGSEALRSSITGTHIHPVRFVTKKVSPASISIYSNITGAINNVRDSSGGGVDNGATAITRNGQIGFNVTVTTNDAAAISFQWTANAEL